MKQGNPIGWRFARGNAKLSGMVHAFPALCAAAGAIGASATFAWGSVAPSAQLFGPTIRRTGDPLAMALTFDDGPNPEATRSLLDLLDRHRVQATFFLIGAWVRREPSLAKDISDRGHAVGNHTDSHPGLTLLSRRRIAEELDRCDEAIESATAQKPRWMRPPFGYRSPVLDRIVRGRGAAGVVMWSVSARDWKVQRTERVIERLRRAQGGDIVLLHDGDHRVMNSDRCHTVAALQHWLPRWKDAGIRFVTLDQVQQHVQSGRI
ncbi:MAG TPA: polysaccharide deacetylase family protein [Candidatus Acidoferrales bacterium]